MRIAIDTNRLADLFRADSMAVMTTRQVTEVFVPIIVVGELEAGCAHGTRLAQNLAVLDRFLAKPGVQILFPGRETARVYANLYASLRKTGTPIPDNDLWIASLAVQKSLPLFARDAHFARVAGLALL